MLFEEGRELRSASTSQIKENWWLFLHYSDFWFLPCPNLYYGQAYARARVLPAGVLIILAVLDSSHLDTLRPTSLGLPQGALLAYGRYGENWLAHPEVNIDSGRVGQVPPLPGKEGREQISLQPG
jgi:hypothetical protein